MRSGHAGAIHQDRRRQRRTGMTRERKGVIARGDVAFRIIQSQKNAA
jgi:hypothetical protein